MTDLAGSTTLRSLSRSCVLELPISTSAEVCWSIGRHANSLKTSKKVVMLARLLRDYIYVLGPVPVIRDVKAQGFEVGNRSNNR